MQLNMIAEELLDMRYMIYGVIFKITGFRFKAAVPPHIGALCSSHVHFYHRLYIIHNLGFTIKG